MRNRWRIVSIATVMVVVLIIVEAASAAQANLAREHWIGTWATAPQPALPGEIDTFRNETLRLIVHTSAEGKEVRIKISNTYGDQPLLIRGAHIARRTAGAEIDSASDRKLLFQRHASVSVPSHSQILSDPVEFEAPALSDLAISLFLPQSTKATTSHILAPQTSYVSSTGDFTGAVKLPVKKTIDSWPFLTGVDVVAPLMERRLSHWDCLSPTATDQSRMPITAGRTHWRSDCRKLGSKVATWCVESREHRKSAVA